MSKIRFYKVHIDYIKYLHTIDIRVQYNATRQDAYTENRPYIGVVLTVNGKNYFAPMEHPRSEHQKLKSNPHIFKIDGGKYGLVGLNNMLPIPSEQLISFDINTSPRRKELMSQFIYCQNHFAELTAKANNVYQRRQHPNAFEEKLYCDFAKLEAAADLYRATQQVTPKSSKAQPTHPESLTEQVSF
ncbi:MAG: type III toxin-antitoxin system ToxN/AbiQ family toxin [Lachnospiraceae bacterium]|jgi:protein AbiQ|nr:type III toxin-antitoxin system ToxN/AbiQ family toxin [Lachnospiraceae bacterium]